MEEAVTENTDWIEAELRPLIDDDIGDHPEQRHRVRGAGQYFNPTFPSPAATTTPTRQTYDKVFLPGIEKTYTDSGRDDRLVVETRPRRFGFTTCYDYLFSDLLREYALGDEVDAVVQMASWRAAGPRDYPGMNVRSDATTAICGTW